MSLFFFLFLKWILFWRSRFWEHCAGNKRILSKTCCSILFTGFFFSWSLLNSSQLFSFPNVFIFAGIKLALFWGALHRVQLFPVFSGRNVSWENRQWCSFSRSLRALPFSQRLLLLSLLPPCQGCRSHSLGQLCWGCCCFLLSSQPCPAWQPLPVKSQWLRLTLNLALWVYFPPSISCSSIISTCCDFWGALPFLPGVSHTPHSWEGEEQLHLSMWH